MAMVPGASGLTPLTPISLALPVNESCALCRCRCQHKFILRSKYACRMSVEVSLSAGFTLRVITKVEKISQINIWPRQSSLAFSYFAIFHNVHGQFFETVKGHRNGNPLHSSARFLLGDGGGGTLVLFVVWGRAIF